MKLKDLIDSTVQGYLYRTLSETRGNVTRAAAIAGYSRTMFYPILRRYGIYVGKMRRDEEHPGATHIPRSGHGK